MSGNWPLNGSDYLMLGFDHELRREGFAGNSCQIVLELAGRISREELAGRLRELTEEIPLLRTRPGGIFRPHWRGLNGKLTAPKVTMHADEPEIEQNLFNQALDTRRGELMRFDVLERKRGGSSLIFTWSHALMDGPGGEHFLALVGNRDVAVPNRLFSEPVGKGPSFRERTKLAWRYLHHIDTYCKQPAKTMGVRHSAASAELRYSVERFSLEETNRARANGVKLCGPLGDGQFHAAAAMMELHRLHERLGSKSASYILPIPVGMRPKGKIEPLFGNQMAMLMLQILPEHLASMEALVGAIKEQTSHLLRSGLMDCGVKLSEMFRFLPLPVYMALLKQGLKGEICSIFCGDTAGVTPLLSRFMGTEVEDFAHVAPVTPTPGVGIVFYSFRGELRVSVIYSMKVLNPTEAAGFAAGVRARLLEQ